MLPDHSFAPSDAEPDQNQAPLFDKIFKYPTYGITPLHTPGHKGTAAAPGLLTLLTPRGLRSDLPSMEATDNSFYPKGCIAQAQRLAALLYGAADTFFLVNGSTCGVQAMFLGTLAPGDKVLLPRYMHLSAFSALVLSGAVPVYLKQRWQSVGGPVPPTVDELIEGLAAHPDAKAFFLTHPTCYGVGQQLAPLVEACRRRGVLVLVDETHGAHLPFLPDVGPRPALHSGADAVVQSVHKVAGLLSGTALLHRGAGSRITPTRLQSALNLLQSTSPSYLLFASIDLTRRWLWQNGRKHFAEAVARALQLRNELNRIPGLRVLMPEEHEALTGCAADPLRLLIDVAGLRLGGLAVANLLSSEFSLDVDFYDARSVACILGPGEQKDLHMRLLHALRTLADRQSGAAVPALTPPWVRAEEIPPMRMLPREAVFREKERVSLSLARGRICGERIIIYPPGIPLIYPGEEVTVSVVTRCEEVSAEREYVLAEDPSLRTLSVLR